MDVRKTRSAVLYGWQVLVYWRWTISFFFRLFCCCWKHQYYLFMAFLFDFSHSLSHHFNGSILSLIHSTFFLGSASMKMKSANDKEVLSIEIYLHIFPVWFDKISSEKKSVYIRRIQCFFSQIMIYLLKTFTHLAQLFWDFSSLRIEYPQCINAIYQFDGPLLIPFNLPFSYHYLNFGVIVSP